MLASVLMLPTWGVSAADSPVDQDLANFFGYDWGASNPYPTPYDINGAPGFVPFNDVMKGYGDKSKVLENGKFSQVAAEITNTAKVPQAGALWSTHQLDLTKNFHARMQFYLSDVNDVADVADVADGIAFAMTGQKPEKAMGDTADGGDLGIWGKQSNGQYKLPRSFAIAIDTEANVDTGKPAWDYAIYNQVKYNNAGTTVTPRDNDKHKEDNFIAYGYPGMDAQYAQPQITTTISDNWGDYPVTVAPQILAFGGDGNSYGDGAAAKNGIGGFDFVPKDALNNHAWHELNLDYTYANGEGTLTYTVTLKNTDGTAQGSPITETVKWTDAKIQKIFGGTKVNWGFTGRTGLKHENGVVAFQQIPGLLDTTSETLILDSTRSKELKSLVLGGQGMQVFRIGYKPTNSLQSWPAVAGGKLSAILKAGKNYGFVVSDDGKVHGLYNHTGDEEYTYTPDSGDIKTYKGPDGKSVRYVTEVRIKNELPGFSKANSYPDYDWELVYAPVVAIGTDSSVGTEAMGTVGGDNGLTSVSGTLTVPHNFVLSLDSVPSFDFGKLTVGDIMSGFTNHPGTVSNSLAFSASEENNIQISASMSSFNFGPSYTPGSTAVKFTYNGAERELTDNGEATSVYAGSPKNLTSAVTNASLNMPKGLQGAKAGLYNSTITWTLEQTPTADASSAN